MRCFKLLGERGMARDFDRQVAESYVRAAILNRFARLGTPTTVAMPACRSTRHRWQSMPARRADRPGPLLQIVPRSARSLACSSRQSDIDVHGDIESAGAVFCQADHQQAKRFERLGHVRGTDIQRPQAETLEESRDAGLGLCVVGCHERIGPSTHGKDVAEEGVERFHDMRAGGEASGSFLPPELPLGVTRPERSGGDRVGDVDDHLAAQRRPEIGHHRRRTAVWHGENDDVALWCGAVRPGGRAGANGQSKNVGRNAGGNAGENTAAFSLLANWRVRRIGTFFSADYAVNILPVRLGHLWLVTLHPFDDGNGRIARAVGDLLLARAEGSPRRFYSLSAQIQRERKTYYEILERTQQGSMDVTPWLLWFFHALQDAVELAHLGLDAVLAKARFWRQWAEAPMNERQVKLLNRLLDDYEGKLTTSKWAAIAKCSTDTALRDISDLVVRGVLRNTAAGGRSTGYELAELAG